MATVYKTPGVYVEEIPKLPPSVAQVETAIPAFIGYTAKAEKLGENLLMKPTRLSSLLEFMQYFGGDKIPGDIDVVVDAANNYAVTEVTVANTERYFMFDGLRTFFDNGGGDCYIISVGLFGAAPAIGDDTTGFQGGLRALEKIDEPTLILFPDACRMVLNADDPNLYSLQQQALQQCAKLQDRFGVFDLKENLTGPLVNADANQENAVTNFRNNIGINNLKYGAAYTPWIYTTYPRDVDFNTFSGNVTSGGSPVDLGTVTSDATLNELVSVTNQAFTQITNSQTIINNIRRADPATGNPDGTGSDSVRTIKDKFAEFKRAVDTATDSAGAKAALDILMNFSRKSLLAFQALSTQFTGELLNSLNAYAASPTLWRGSAVGLIGIDKNTDVLALTEEADVPALYPAVNAVWLGLADAAAVAASTKDYGDSATVANHPAMGRLIALDVQAEFDKLAAFAESITNTVNTYKKTAQDNLYERHTIIGNIVKNIKKELSRIPPSGAVVGVYARVDNARGVWKAPANESLNSVLGPSVNISHEEQANLNVDAVAGKSINAIRAFTGKGTLVWGARTLAGNDNEWRYVSVRRFFNMVEESCKKATEPFVFEPNDANTWIKVQAMIENFLTNLWRQGALQGAKPEHAFYVAIGLGKTMTALDILEGRMIVEIGMAVVRPAEFIILQFSHKMAES
ncbi:phage tail sheath family protein [Nibrella saemangeumensis]|uniref:Phage tail sheath family protein n=1 Tax=Nibrella saemangeumensis TaxID=1084526 RepID=A0ABP8N627_9BACT